jgi:hypothetical protein
MNLAATNVTVGGLHVPLRHALRGLVMLAGFALVPMAAYAKAGEFTGDDFFQYCLTDNPDRPAGSRYEQDMVTYCSGYMEGSITTILALNGRLVCLPDDSTPADIYGAAVAFMQKHPEQKQYLLGSVIIAAVRARWPCR